MKRLLLAYALAGSTIGLTAAPASACDLGPFSIHFRTGSALISSAGRTNLDAQAAMFHSLGGKRDLRLTAHADTVGDKMANLRLSKRRADAAKAYLVRQGVPKSQIEIVSRGEAAPPEPTPDETPERSNRRVLIEFVEPTCGG